MFVLMKEPRVWWPVTVQKPVDGGAVEEERFEAQFLLIGQDEIEAVSGATGGQKAMLARVLVGWRGVAQQDKGELPFTAENRDLVIDVPYVRRALGRAFLNAAYGAKEKNSGTPPSDGPAAASPAT